MVGVVLSASAQINPISSSARNNEPGLLEVKGDGRLMVQPDQTIVLVQVQSSNSEAGRAVQVVTDRVEQLLRKLNDAGFRKDEIKTSQFFLSENNEWRDGNMIRNGYNASQTMEIKFGLDPRRMTRLTQVFADTQEGVTFQFSFGLSDKLRQQTKEELIRKALQDAREKASVIARSANIRLGSIRKIDYGRQNVVPYGPVMNVRTEAMMDKQAEFPQTEIQDMELTDEIVVIWTLEQ
ncbi:MAG: SIMPL domain-containing protein [Bacteroidetes bacterium]|nr:SIMPL domain-containing protein [Bacteroidota bacterium]